MRTEATDISEFYQQLALLIRANLPLPDALRRLSESMGRKDFRDAVRQIGNRVSEGNKFSEILRQYRTIFSPLEVQLIAAGETTNSLPVVLFAVARYCRFNQLLTAKVRSILAYPLVTLNMGLIAFFFVGMCVMPDFVAMYDEMFGPRIRIPLSSRLVFMMSNIMTSFPGIIIVGYTSFLVFTIWLFGPFLLAERTLMRIIRRLPGSCPVVDSLDWARLCRVWSAFINQNVPIQHAFSVSSQLVEQANLSAALSRVAAAVEAGRKPGTALEDEPSIDSTLLLTFKHAAEDKLGEELERLAELYEHRVLLAARSATVVWSAVSMTIVSVIIGLIIVGMFKPLTTFISLMSA